MAELPLTAPKASPQQIRTAAGRRPKLARGVIGATVRIVRLTVTRQDDDGQPFRTSISLDGALVDLAAQLWGGEVSARARLVQMAEIFWRMDKTARQRTQASGFAHCPPRSVSRHIQSKIAIAASARIAELTRQATLTLPAPAPRKRS